MSSVNVLKYLWLNHPTYGLPTLSRQINIRGIDGGPLPPLSVEREIPHHMNSESLSVLWA